MALTRGIGNELVAVCEIGNDFRPYILTRAMRYYEQFAR